MRNNNHLAQFESEQRGLLTKLGQIIAMMFLNFTNETVKTQAFKQARYLSRAFVGKMVTQS
ncbi:MAG: hypothetical protein KDI02_27200, partial [Anaerolineae bacterium]|nr:hypothetical protein [Anaerolineae bacterium]